MYCSRCGTPLRPGDRFCPRCGAAAPGASAGPGRKGTGKGSGGIRTGWVVLVMVLMVLALLTAAVFSQWDQLTGLFEERSPMPTPRPGQAGVEQLDAVWAPRPDEAVPAGQSPPYFSRLRPGGSAPRSIKK